jgi:hypothetical protein
MSITRAEQSKTQAMSSGVCIVAVSWPPIQAERGRMLHDALHFCPNDLATRRRVFQLFQFTGRKIVAINGWNRIQVGFRAVHPVNKRQAA